MEPGLGDEPKTVRGAIDAGPSLSEGTEGLSGDVAGARVGGGGDTPWPGGCGMS